MEYPVRGESSTSNSTPPWKYDVFMSFAGKDTRLRFVDHLDEAFNRSGIKTFRDDVDLERGTDIKQNLFQAIQDSLCAVLIISKNYANSTWCLDELQKILESQNTLYRRVFPIFYDVDPADVRHQRKSFGEALAKHEKFIEYAKKVQKWKNVLFEIGNLSGWDTRGTHEAYLIKAIVGAVWTYLSSKLPSCYDNLVGIESRVLDMMPFLEIGLDDTRFVGIWGMGGVGKTTLARVVFEKLSYKFEICCFLANVRETLQREGLLSLQKRLLSHLQIKDMGVCDDYEGMKMIRKFLRNKKVLLVLDNLDDISQLKNLAESPNWFGKGSRIIITTRNSHLLTSSGVGQRIYKMKTMKKDESHQLFSNKAFNKDHPRENYLELSESVVKYAGGLPLAIITLGSFLCGRTKAEWRDALDRLKQTPDDDILQVLKISYDGLKNEEEKTIFLDIACFFKGWQKKEVTQILESCGLHVTIGIKVLIEKALLVETKDCKLEMHDLLEELGRHIVHQESPNKVGKRSRLWKFEDIKEVLENNTGSETIQAIVMQGYYGDPDKVKVHTEAFLKMSNIRLLLLHPTIDGPLISPNTSRALIVQKSDPLIFLRGSKLSGALKVIRWSSFTSETLPLETPLDKLVYIQMHYSKVKQLWNDIQFMRKLKFIDLSYSRDFAETPDFSGVPYLEHLCLRHCTSLVKVHSSLGELKELAELCLSGCVNLEILPRRLETNSLIKLDLSECEKVATLPEFGEGMKKLSYLNVSETAITSLPDDFSSLTSLIVLDLSGNNFVNLPTDCFSSLFRLVFLSLDCCKWLESLPRLPPGLIRLNASGCNSMEPLSDRRLWNLVASLDHKYRGRTKYVIYDEEYDDIPLELKHVELERVPLRDFCGIIPGFDIPSWFPNREYYYLHENIEEYVIKVNIPPSFLCSEWFGIVVCFLISGSNNLMISWSSKAPADADYIRKECSYLIALRDDQSRHLCIMVLELNEEICWQHLRTSHNYSVHIKLCTLYYHYWSLFGANKSEILGSGWRVICQEEIQEWCHLNHFNQVAQPQLASSHEVKLPRRILDDFTSKVGGELHFPRQDKNEPVCNVM